MPVKKKKAFVRQQCRVDGCKSKENFAQPSRLTSHLMSKHGFNLEDVENYFYEMEDSEDEH